MENLEIMTAEIGEANTNYEDAQSRGTGLQSAKTRLMNTLFNFHKAIMALCEAYREAQETIQSLQDAILEADEQIKKLKAEQKGGGQLGIGKAGNKK